MNTNVISTTMAGLVIIEIEYPQDERGFFLESWNRRAFAEAVSARGVDRIVPLGRMHDFDLPWDGVLALNRLVRWVILKV